MNENGTRRTVGGTEINVGVEVAHGDGGNGDGNGDGDVDRDPGGDDMMTDWAVGVAVHRDWLLNL